MSSKSTSNQSLSIYVIFLVSLFVGIFLVKSIQSVFPLSSWTWEVLIIFWMLSVSELFHRYWGEGFPSVISFLSKTSTVGKIRYFGLVVFVFVAMNIFSELGRYYFRYFDAFTLAITMCLILFSRVR